MNEHIDMKISGSSTMPGGEYGSVSISGAGKVNGSLKCEELHCSGAAKVQGDVDCAGELHTSGAGKIAGSVRCGSLSASGDFFRAVGAGRGLASVSGSLRTERALTADELSASGSLEAGSIHCRAFRASGSCRVSGDLEAETAVLSGAAEIGGLLNAETVEISANRAVRIHAIGGGTIRVLQKDTAVILGLFRTTPGRAHRLDRGRRYRAGECRSRYRPRQIRPHRARLPHRDGRIRRKSGGRALHRQPQHADRREININSAGKCKYFLTFLQMV